jgi:N-methylhydantoinase A
MRYAGQAYEIRVPLTTSQNGQSLEPRLRQAINTFHSSHKDLYGYSYEGKELIELVNIGVTGLGLLPRPRVPELPTGGVGPQAALAERTHVYFSQTHDFVDCPVYHRSALRAENTVRGPAIIAQYDATTVVDIGWQGQVDRWGTLVLTKE